LLKLLLVFAKIVIITLVFEKNANFSPKLGKIAENCNHNIDPWSPLFGQAFEMWRHTTYVERLPFLHLRSSISIRGLEARMEENIT
jgi:hypothetical protein